MKPSDNTVMSQSPTSSSKRKNDLLLILILALGLALAALGLFLFRKTGDTVTVLIDGTVQGEYRLDEDREIEIRVPDGYNILVIENGSAYIRNASCPDGICVAHRPISHSGESIICLPNKVVIEVHTQEQNQPDIIS